MVQQLLKKDWVNIAFLSLTPVSGVAGTALYTWRYGFHLWMPLLTISLFLGFGMSICAGYDRFFSRKSFESSPFVPCFYAISRALAAENPIIWWSAAHRIHHKYVD